MMRLKWFTLVIGLLFLTNSVVANGLVLTKKIVFDIGTKSANLYGAVQGFNATHYTFYAHKGEVLHIRLKSAKAHFNLYAPHKNEHDMALFSSKIEGASYEGKIDKDGIYTLKIYLAYADAKKEIKTLYSLNITME